MASRVFYGELPDGYSIKTFAIREKKTGDLPAIQSSISRLHPDAVKMGGDVLAMANITETIRHLLVEVDGVQVNKSTPFMAMDEWTDSTTGIVAEAYIAAFRSSEGKAKGEIRTM